MDIALVVIGIFLYLLASAFEKDSGMRKSLKVVGAVLFLIGGLLFVYTFFQGYNAVRYRLNR